MQYVEGQPPQSHPLWPRQLDLLKRCLRQYIVMTRDTEPSLCRRAAHVYAHVLPKHLPYRLELVALEWEIISRALRFGGPDPEPGSLAAQGRALYHNLRKRFYFKTVQRQVEWEKSARRAGLANLRKPRSII